MYVAYRTDEFEDAAKARAKEILDQMTPKTRQLAMIAIKDAFDDDNAFEMNWEIIATALTKKSVDNYEKYGFGIWFNRNFLANVHKQMERNIEAEELTKDDYEKFFSDDPKEETKPSTSTYDDGVEWSF